MQVMIDTKLDRVDLVEEGSCSEAYIMMYKGKDGALKVSKERVEAILAKMKPEYATEVREYFEDQIEKAKCKKSEEDAELDKAKEDLKAANKELQKTKDELKDANEELAKAKQDLAAANKNLEDVAKSKGNEEPDFEEVLKAAPEAMRGFLKQLKQSQDEAVAKAKQLEEEKAHNEAVAKAKELSVLPVKEQELVDLFKSKEGAVVAPMLEKIAKSIMESGLLDEKGTGVNYNNNDANADIDARVEALAKSKNISKEKAMVEIFQADPEAYAKYNGGV